MGAQLLPWLQGPSWRGELPHHAPGHFSELFMQLGLGLVRHREPGELKRLKEPTSAKPGHPDWKGGCTNWLSARFEERRKGSNLWQRGGTPGWRESESNCVEQGFQLALKQPDACPNPRDTQLIPSQSKTHGLLRGWNNCGAHFKTETALYRKDIILRHTYPCGSAGLSKETKPLRRTRNNLTCFKKKGTLN